MTISIYTMILPRLEVFFLEEWFEHHLMLGIDVIHVYDNGLLSIQKNKSGDSYKGTKWRKKPYADYYLDYTDEQIYDKLNEVVDKFSNVHLKKWRTEVECKVSGRSRCQLLGYKDCVENNKSDWWIHIDPDEYIFPIKHKNIRAFLNDDDNKHHSAFVLNQRIFNTRQRDKKVREIVNWSWEGRRYGGGMVKTIIKNKIKTFYVHTPIPEDGRVKQVPNEVMVYYHYHGPILGEGFRTRELFIERSKKDFNKTDASMLKFLKK